MLPQVSISLLEVEVEVQVEMVVRSRVSLEGCLARGTVGVVDRAVRLDSGSYISTSGQNT